jgi:heat shock protein HslJ
MNINAQFQRSARRVGILVAVLALAGLVLAGCGGGTTETTQPEAGEFSLTGVVWQWQEITIVGQDTQTVPNPASYTITFNEDGTLGGMNDCNSYTGSYTTEDGGIQIQLGATTAAACGEESMDILFSQSLAMIVAGGPDGTGNLALESAGAERRMIFSNGGPAPAQ